VVEKAGFAFVREVEDTHEGEVLRVKAWEFPPSSATPEATHVESK
jgi:hypothetical protein